MAEEWSCETCEHSGSGSDCCSPRECIQGSEWSQRNLNPFLKSTLEKTILDSGNRREFESGAVRDMQEGKGRCDLLPLLEVADLLEGEPVIKAIYMYQQTGKVEFIKGAIAKFCIKVEWSYAQAMLELAKHFEQGAKKYGDRNWEKGIPEWAFIDSAVRHYLKWLDAWTDEPHDRAVLWNLICLWWTHEHITVVDERTCDECKYEPLPADSYPCCECHEGSKYTEEGSENHAEP